MAPMQPQHVFTQRLGVAPAACDTLHDDASAVPVVISCSMLTECTCHAGVMPGNGPAGAARMHMMAAPWLRAHLLLLLAAHVCCLQCVCLQPQCKW
jgi:hypothetical protein